MEFLEDLDMYDKAMTNAYFIITKRRTLDELLDDLEQGGTQEVALPFDPHIEDLIDLLYREKYKNKFKIEKAPYVYDEDDLPWWMEPYRENDPIDVGPAEIKGAQGGRVPLAWGGILKLL